MSMTYLYGVIHKMIMEGQRGKAECEKMRLQSDDQDLRLSRRT